MARTHGIAIPLLALFAAAVLATSGTASAIYIYTPLQFENAPEKADVGDTLDLVVVPDAENASAKTDHAGKTLRAVLGWSASEGQEPDASASEEDAREEDIGTVALDADARGSLTWTVPAEVDDKNVFIRLETAEGEAVAFAYIAIGDAEPVMMIAASGPSEGGEGVEEPTATPVEEGGNLDDTNAESSGGRSNVPGAPVVAALVGIGALALALRRR